MTATENDRIGRGMLVATACGTAIASVSALGLFQIERLVGGVWSLGAVAVAALMSWGVARAFARLCAVVPSGAGLLAYLARGFGRQAGMALALPYLLLTLFLVGIEALVVGTMLGRLLGVPALVGALGLVAVTFAVCRAGIRVGYRTQAVTTGALVAGMAALSLAVLLRHAPSETAALLARPAPTAARFAAAVGQALFLFMGFELCTTQVEVARSPAAVGRALGASVGVLAAFYGLCSLGFAALPTAAGVDPLVPQLEMARAAGGTPAVVACVALCLLASFTSLNGALLALGRFVYALSVQGVLPRSLAAQAAHGPRLIPRRALALLAAVAAGSTLLMAGSGLWAPVIVAAAASAALAYAAALVARQRAPFAEADRSFVRRAAGLALAAVLAALGVAVLAGAGRARGPAVVAAAVALALSLLAIRRVGARPLPRAAEVRRAA